MAVRMDVRLLEVGLMQELIKDWCFPDFPTEVNTVAQWKVRIVVCSARMTLCASAISCAKV